MIDIKQYIKILEMNLQGASLTGQRKCGVGGRGEIGPIGCHGCI